MVLSCRFHVNVKNVGWERTRFPYIPGFYYDPTQRGTPQQGLSSCGSREIASTQFRLPTFGMGPFAGIVLRMGQAEWVTCDPSWEIVGRGFRFFLTLFLDYLDIPQYIFFW